MSSGLPCVATRLEGSTDGLIDDRVNGLLVAPDDEAGMAAAVRWLLTDSRTRRHGWGRPRATPSSTTYAIQTAAALWLAAYQELSTS